MRGGPTLSFEDREQLQRLLKLKGETWAKKTFGADLPTIEKVMSGGGALNKTIRRFEEKLRELR